VPGIPDIPEAPSPTSVELDRATALTISWPDGTTDTFGIEELRFNCPCAGCRGRREQGLDAWPTPGAPQPLHAESAELVGAWGIQIHWNDGHETGIYAWSMLQAWRATDEPAES
jgi:DUF971 family protein